MDYKKDVNDDLKEVFQKILSIFRGKIKGYAGIPDSNFLRENLLKAEIKLLVKEIIQEFIDKT